MRRLSLFLIFLLLGILPTFAQDAAGGDYFVESSVDNPAPFIGQQITYSFRLYDAVGLDNPLYEPSDFEGFWRVDLAGVSQRLEQLNGRQYSVSEIRTALYPTRIGDITIAPASAVLPETVFQPKRELKADSVVVQAQPLPDGAPPDFSGAVGQFQMSATLDRQSIKLGEPVKLQITITGNGNIEQLPLPSVPVPSTWRSYENPSSYTAAQQDDKIIGTKTFELLIFPDQPGAQSLPVVSLSYFDPSALAYRSVSTSPVQVEVLPSDSVQPQVASAPSAVSPNFVIAFKPLPASLQIGGDSPGLGFWLLWLIPPGIIIAAWGWRLYNQRVMRDRAIIRRSHALRVANNRMDAARRMAAKEASAQVRAAVLGYIADRLNADTENALNLDWRDEGNKKNLPLQTSRQLQSCLELASQGLYAPTSELDGKSLVERVSRMLAEIDRTWK